MLAEGIELMVIGMGTVFAFLTLLVLTMHSSAWLIATYFPPSSDPDPTRVAPSTESAESEIAAVLAIAHRWRQGQGD